MPMQLVCDGNLNLVIFLEAVSPADIENVARTIGFMTQMGTVVVQMSSSHPRKSNWKPRQPRIACEYISCPANTRSSVAKRSIG